MTVISANDGAAVATDFSVALVAHQLWVVECEGDVQGVIELVLDADHLLIENIAVDPAHQRDGIGRLLLLFAEQEAVRQQCVAVRLYTNERFTENLAIYTKLGYPETGRETAGTTQLVHLSKVLRPL